MQLYYSQTPNPRKACAVARHCGADVEYIHVDLAKGEHKQPAYLAINPNGKTPALADGDLHFWEAHAIMAYVAYKAGSDLWPSDPVAQIEVTCVCFYLSRAHDILRRAHEILRLAHELLSLAHDILSRAYEILCRAHEILSRAHEILSRAHEIINSCARHN